MNYKLLSNILHYKLMAPNIMPYICIFIYLLFIPLSLNAAQELPWKLIFPEATHIGKFEGTPPTAVFHDE